MRSLLALSLIAGVFGIAQTPPAAPRTSGDSVGPYDKQVVDPAAAARGQAVYAVECVDCHGPTARGGAAGPNLIRSVVVLHDKVGSDLGPFLKKGHLLQSRRPGSVLTDDQIADLSHFLKARVADSLKRQPMGDNINVIRGDAAAGKAYFDGEGTCATCHTGARSLAGVATRYPDPVDLQQAMLFPTGRGRGRGRGRGAPPSAPVMLTVTPVGGPPVAGTLVFLDDFAVQLRDASGKLHSWTRSPGLTVVKTDPLAAHHALLDRVTDTNVHDLVVYLETLK
jgi:mono/diheme cytochrome c family protein